MKKLFTILIAGVAFHGCHKDSSTLAIKESQENAIVTRATADSSDDYYWFMGEKIPLQKMNNKFYVMYDPADEEKLIAELTKTGVVFKDVRKNDSSQYDDIKNFDAKKFANLKTAIIEGNREKIAPVLAHTYYSAPYYITEIGEGRLTNRFSLPLNDVADLEKLKKLADENSVEILGVSELDGWYELACSNFSRGNALEMGNLFYETGLFDGVGYDLGARGRINCINEPLFTNGFLWHLGNNPMRPDVHINYCNARAIVPQASSYVKIAVVDSGVQYDHSDLYNVLPGWDAESQSVPNIITNTHGTNVTGFIAAIPDNVEAVAGVAHGVTILPVSFRANFWGDILSTYDVMVRAVNYAVTEGAKVINCSWGYSDNRVVNAVKGALDNDCVVVFASGNGYGAVSSPANSDSRILVVGAVGNDGTRASFSNYGPELDVVAPGDNLASTTVGSNYAYVTGIGGTSFAAPQVAGIAALILSENPHFTAQRVINSIERSTRKVNIFQGNIILYKYDKNVYGRQNGTWSIQMGYGLVDAHAALVDAAGGFVSELYIGGPDKVWAGASAAYTVENLPAHYQDDIIWTCTPSGPLYYYNFDSQTGELYIFSHEGAKRESGTLTITAEIPQLDWQASKTVQWVKTYIDGTINVPGMGRVPFFALSNGDITGMTAYLPGGTTVDITLTYPGTAYYYSTQTNFSRNAGISGYGLNYTATVNPNGELDADIIYTTPSSPGVPTLPQLKYKLRLIAQ